MVEEPQLGAAVLGRVDRLLAPLEQALRLGERASFSTWLAAGMKKTSVRQVSGVISPVSVSGPFFQNVALSIW